MAGSGTFKSNNMNTTTFAIISVVWMIVGIATFTRLKLQHPNNWKQDVLWTLATGPIGMFLMVVLRFIEAFTDVLVFFGEKFAKFYDSLK